MIERQQAYGNLLSFMTGTFTKAQLISVLAKNCYGMNSFNLLKKKKKRATVGCVAFYSWHIMAYLLLLMINK